MRVRHLGNLAVALVLACGGTDDSELLGSGSGGNGAGGMGGMSSGGSAGSGAAQAATSCDSDNDCTPLGQLCHPTLARCVDCVVPTDCEVTETCRGGMCQAFVQCRNSLDCVDAPDGRQICNSALGDCVQCVQAADCGASRTCADNVCEGASGASGDGGSGGTAGAPATGGTGGGGSGGVPAAGGTGGVVGTGCPADVIVALDNSASMAEEAATLQADMEGFIGTLQNAGIDVRVNVVSDTVQMVIFPIPIISYGICLPAPIGSGMCPEDTNPPTYLHVLQVVGTNDALLQLMNAYPSYSSNLRPLAPKTIVVVTDDDAVAPPTVEEFIQFFTSSFGAAPWRFSGVFCVTAGANCAATSLVYQELVGRTGGLQADLATQTVDVGLGSIANSVISFAQCQ